MRTISTALNQVLTGTSRSDHLKVEVDSDGAGTFVNISSYFDLDWVISCTITENEDQPTATATLQIKRSFEDLHMSPLVAGSVINTGSVLLYINREIKISCATVGADTTPQTADWALRFHGYIDSVNPGGDVIKVSCRDLGAKVVDQYIKTIAQRGTSGGQAVQTAMQAIVTAAMSPVPTIYVPASPSWVILEYQQGKETVMSALTTLADQLGWIIRYRWRSGTSAFELTFYGPDRAVSSTVRDFTPAQYYKITNAAISLESVRTEVAINYYTTPDAEMSTYIATSAGPIVTKYGDRYMEITNKATSNIDLLAEATTMGDNILADLEEPGISHAVTMPLFWPAELGDYYGFTSNKVIYDSTQNLALFSVTHKFVGGRATTTMKLRGKPASASVRWLGLEGRPGVAPIGVNYTPDIATGLASAAAAGGGIVITYDDPHSMFPPIRDWFTTKLYVSESSGFTPGSSNLKAMNKSTRFVVEDLVSGTTYYAKIQIIDSSGNVSTTSAQETIVAGYAGALVVSPRNDNESLVINGAMADWTSPNTQATTPPDGWVVVKDIGAGDVEDPTFWRSTPIPFVFHESTLIQSADTAVKISTALVGTANGYGIRTKGLIPVIGGKYYDVRSMQYLSALLGPAHSAIVTWYAANGITVLGTSGAGMSSVATTWEDITRVVAAFPTAKWAKIHFILTERADTAIQWYIDKVSMTRKKHSFSSIGGVQAIGGTGAYGFYINWAAASPNYGGGFSAPNLYIAPDDGTYMFNSVIELAALPVGQEMQIAIYVNTVIVKSSVIAENNSAGARNTFATIDHTVDLNIGDSVGIYVRQNSGGGTPLNTVAGGGCIFSGAQV